MERAVVHVTVHVMAHVKILVLVMEMVTLILMTVIKCEEHEKVIMKCKEAL